MARWQSTWCLVFGNLGVVIGSCGPKAVRVSHTLSLSLALVGKGLVPMQQFQMRRQAQVEGARSGWRWAGARTGCGVALLGDRWPVRVWLKGSLPSWLEFLFLLAADWYEARGNIIAVLHYLPRNTSFLRLVLLPSQHQLLNAFTTLYSVEMFPWRASSDGGVHDQGLHRANLMTFASYVTYDNSQP